MPVLPIPMFAALVLGYVWLRAALLRETPRLMLVLIAACALQSLLISLNQHYHVTALAPVQPITALAIPALAYLAFLDSAVRRLRPLDLALHALGPLLGLASYLLLREILDALIIASYLSYGIALLWRMASGADSLPRVALEHGNRAMVIWRAVAIALLVSAVSDCVIAISMALGDVWLRSWIVSFVSTGLLLVIGVLNISEALKRSPEDEPGTAAPRERQTSPIETVVSAEEDVALISDLRILLAEQQLYLDPSLSLGKLARRLRVPEKQLSAAINRQTGENVSRYINSFRIDYACDLLQQGQPVTAVIFASGFNTKSNFNREFLRLKGTAPSVWLKQQAA
ncbi:helix-turn-helix domain-containing protein [Roseibium sp.]|uniref:helix-turn-helix domain-containing protein n=1 Tax=Roseibium sp. TaxID=1936156 RepID=UPI003A97A3C1